MKRSYAPLAIHTNEALQAKQRREHEKEAIVDEQIWTKNMQFEENANVEKNHRRS